MKRTISKTTPRPVKQGVVVGKHSRSGHIVPQVRYCKINPIEGDPYKSDDPTVQKKLDIMKSMEGMWANKDTSFFDRKHGK